MLECVRLPLHFCTKALNSVERLKPCSTADQPVPKELYVISDRACKTMTYLLAMTYNFPAVSFQWVLHSVATGEQKNFRHYMLPVGYR